MPAETTDVNPTATRGARELLASGKARFKACEFTQAFEDLGRALEIDPSLADARFMRAQVLENRDLEFALKEYTGLVTMDPNRTDAYLARAALRRAQGDMMGAMADYQALESMVRLAPVTAPLRLKVARERAVLYETMGFHHGAAAEYQLLAEHDGALARPDHQRSMLRNQSRQYWKAGRFAQSAQGFDHLIEEARALRKEINPFDLLWRHIARARVDPAQADAELLNARPAPDTPYAVRATKSSGAGGWDPVGPACPTTRWPMPVFDLMCGRITPNEYEALTRHALVVSDAWHPPAPGQHAGVALFRPPPQHLWRAEVLLYLGQWHLLNGYHYMGLHCMEAAAADTRARTFESQAAAAELARLATTGP
jgi:tetratricopeptide (TPR) repeat protein